MILIAKTEMTLKLEQQIYTATAKQGTFGCFEVTIGWYGRERVDYMTYDTNGIFRCYEIKVSLSDFRSPAIKSFCGHFNYYVLTEELYEKVKGDIPKHIGVYVGGRLAKRPKKQELQVDEQTLKNSLIRSLAREAQKLYRSDNQDFINGMNRRISYEQREKERYRLEYQNLYNEIRELYGRNWRDRDKAQQDVTFM